MTIETFVYQTTSLRVENIFEFLGAWVPDFSGIKDLILKGGKIVDSTGLGEFH